MTQPILLKNAFQKTEKEVMQQAVFESAYSICEVKTRRNRFKHRILKLELLAAAMGLPKKSLGM